MKAPYAFPEDLIQLRRRQGISLQQVSKDTKIAVRYLEAIENAKFGRLPGGVYNVSYIRQYARAVDCDESSLVAYYRVVVPPQAPDLDPPRRETPISRLRDSFRALGMLLRWWPGDPGRVQNRP